MHADEAGRKRVAAPEAARAHHGQGDGGVDFFGQAGKFRLGPPAHHAAAADEQGLPGGADHIGQDVDGAAVGLARLEGVGGAC